MPQANADPYLYRRHSKAGLTQSLWCLLACKMFCLSPLSVWWVCGLILNVVSPLQLNRFKGLDLIDRVPDEQWMEVRDIVQETGIKTIPMEKKCKKAKWLSEEALRIAVRRREAKSKGKRERYKQNAEFQRIARRDKKAFFSNQCKEIEENNRMGKTRDLFKKIRNTKGTFHERWAR